MGGLVTYTLPVQAFVTGIKISDQWKMWSIAWLFPSEALDNLIYIASFPGLAQLFVAFKMKKQEKDASVSPLFCTASDGKMGGAWKQSYDLQSFKGKLMTTYCYCWF